MRRLTRKGLVPLALAVLLTAPTGCHPTRGARGPLQTFNSRTLTGSWIGERLDQPAPGIQRATTLWLELEARDDGTLGGHLHLQGALGSGIARTLMCVSDRRALLTRSAALRQGRFAKRSATWQLADLKLSGEKRCQGRFPLGARCQAEATGAGLLRVRCGEQTLPLRPVSLTGTWAWDEERSDRSGDTVIHRLRLHLAQDAAAIRGYLDDIRVRISGDGQRYRCNGRLRYDRQARHHVQGRLRGHRLSLQVTRTVPKNGPCQGRVELPPVLNGTWNPLQNKLTLTIGGDEHVLWRRPPPARGR